MTVFLIVGLPGAGKTTRARELEISDLIEGKLIDAGMRAAQLGLNVVFDFGLWAKDERSALRWIAGTLGVRAQVVYLPIGYEEQRRRISSRYETEPGQFRMSDTELQQWRSGPRSAGHRCQIGTGHRRGDLAQNADIPRAGPRHDEHGRAGWTNPSARGSGVCVGLRQPPNEA